MCISVVWLFDDVAMLVCPPVALKHTLLHIYFCIASSHMRYILVPSFSHEKSEGPYRFLKCIHGALCCQMLQVRRDNLLGCRVCKIHLCHAPHKHLFMALQWICHSRICRLSYSCIVFCINHCITTDLHLACSFVLTTAHILFSSFACHVHSCMTLAFSLCIKKGENKTKKYK